MRRLLVEIDDDFLTHPQLGPWLRGESDAPTLCDFRNYRRAPETIDFPEHDDDLARVDTRNLTPLVERVSTLEISFDVNPVVVEDARESDLTKESDRALIESFFQMPLSIRAGDRQLLKTIRREAIDRFQQKFIASALCCALSLILNTV